jgi:hypothetical protein
VSDRSGGLPVAYTPKSVQKFNAMDEDAAVFKRLNRHKKRKETQKAGLSDFPFLRCFVFFCGQSVH